MRAGFSKYRVGVFLSSQDSSNEEFRQGLARIRLELPDQLVPEQVMQYNNRLVDLCGLTYAQLLEAISGKAEKKRPQRALAAPKDGEAEMAANDPRGPLGQQPQGSQSAGACLSLGE